MHVTVLQQDLNRALGITGRVVVSRGQLPVLANILIEATKDGLTLAATNLEIGLRVEVGGKVIETGAITIPGKNLGELVGSLSGESLDLQTDGEKLKIKSGNSAGVLVGIAASEFPAFAKATAGEPSVKIKRDLLLEIASQVAFAAATDESRPVLTGCRFSVVGDQMVVVATDGFRLSRKVIQDSKLKIQDSMILPARTILELARIVGESGEITMENVKENNQTIFSCDGVQLISRVLEGNFPEVDKIIPQSFKTEIVADREELKSTLRVAGIFARENSNIVKFRVHGSEFIVKAQAAQTGENESEIEIEKEGEDGEIAFNYKFVQDFLESVTEERIRLKINDSLSPGVWMGEKDKSLIHLIMPVRV